ncbi:hypothetical protein BJX76DRAFT_357294 [Aspergillus varians]
MVMTWNSETDAQLFLGVLYQLRDAKVKLDYEKLAQFMGPECIAGAVQNRIVRLKKKVEAIMGGEDAADAGGANGEASSPGGGGGGVVSDASPRKRKAMRKPKGVSVAKRVKVDPEDGEDDYE